MITKDLKLLLQKLNDHTTRALEAAAGFCISRSHHEVSVEHLLVKLLEDGAGDIPRILQHFGVDAGRFWDALLQHLEGVKGGHSGRPTFSPYLLQQIEAAWLVSSVHHELPFVRSGALLEAFLESDVFRAKPYIDLLSEVNRDELRKNFRDIVGGSAEDSAVGATGARAYTPGTARDGETALDLYTNDVTGQARDGKIDPVFGRDKEIRQIIDILSRRRKNNPILVGEAGVGKTAVVEGLALRLVQGDVPESLREVEIRTLDLGLLQAGAGVKGEFENRLKQVIQEVREAPKPTIMFIDEAHTLIGAGGAAGTADAANLLKPALARGELRTIAATTWSEYKKYIEKDPALERRFQLVKIDEPTVDVATTMLRGIKGIYETHHRVQITSEAAAAAASLADRFISGRQLPDKAVDLLDTAAARVKMTQSATPGELDDVVRRIHNLVIEMNATRKDLERGMRRDKETLEQLEQEHTALEEQREALEKRWQAEKELVLRINTLRDKILESLPVGANGMEALKEPDPAIVEELSALQAELAELQGDSPMVHAEVNEHIAAQIVADWTGIPVGNMVKDEAEILLNLEDVLGERILGQEEAITEVAESIRSSKAGLGNPDAPLAVFLFVGPSGVGKTETALSLADMLFGGERFVTTINMSEYQESHTVSQLKGSPPGYVGYGEGGVLTEAVRRQPYSVVLLDEIEKAHKDILNLFYQVFDKGFMRDGEGREINFKNTVIILTSNLASDIISYVTVGGEEDDEEERPTMDQLRQAIHQTLAGHFQPALLGRMKVVPFFGLGKDTMKGIVALKLDKLGRRLTQSHDMGFDYDEAVVDTIAERCTQVDTGARNVDFIIDRHVLPSASRALITRMTEEEMPARLTLGLDEDGEFTYTFS